MLFGCTASSALEGRIRSARELLVQAARNGAFVCAPRELAAWLAEAG
jgi:hypothetical protein